MEAVIASITWNMHIKDIEQIHYKYDIDLKTEAIMLFHQLIQTYMSVGLFFDMEVHFWYCYIVVLLRVIFGDCVISMFQKKWIKYSPEDELRIHGDTPQVEKSLYVVIGCMMAYDVFRMFKFY
jgi:hypothetical protein